MATKTDRIYRIPIGRWQFIRESSTRCTSRVTSTQVACEHAKAYFEEVGQDFQERFVILTLTTKYEPITYYVVTRGILDASLVHPREVFRPAIADAAAAILMFHNHPSGDVTPSREDFAVTRRLTEAGELIGITVLDHIVYGDETGLTRSIRECT